jgi:hypothetical protein
MQARLRNSTDEFFKFPLARVPILSKGILLHNKKDRVVMPAF